MTEAEAKAWLAARVSHETMEKLTEFANLLLVATRQQNLVANSTIAALWSRHIVDSAQLLDLAVEHAGSWIDLGTGPGLPGLVVAVLHPRPVTLVESRRLRTNFLEETIERLALTNVRVVSQRLEATPSEHYGVISARAFAPLPRLLHLAHRFSTPETIWLLPKGRSAAKELDAVADSWQGEFRLHPSLTDPEAAIIVATSVRSRR